MANDPYTDDEYDDTYEEVHGDEPARDRYADEAEDRGLFAYDPSWGIWPAGWGMWPRSDTVDDDREYGGERYAEYDEAGYDETAYDATTYDEDEGDGSWWDEGLIATLLVVGVVLFLFPEPATSAVGIALLAVGVVAWIVDWAT